MQLLVQAPTQRAAQVRNCREAGVPEKASKILKEGVRGDMVSPPKMKAHHQAFLTRYSSFPWYA